MYKTIFILAATLVTSACASMHSSGSFQAALIRSEPPGATIFLGDKAVGHTPAFIQIPRSRHVSLELTSSATKTAEPNSLESDTLIRSDRESVTLKTKYRWRDSFFSNFVFLTYAPIGWAIDGLTGTSWQAMNSEIIPVRLTAEDRSRRIAARPQRTAIAPPIGLSLALSDAAGLALESFLKRTYSNEKVVIPYEESVSKFVLQGFDHDNLIDDDDRNDLYYSLGVDTIWESTILNRDEQLVLRAYEKNIYTGKFLEPPIDLEFVPSGDFERVYSSGRWWSRIIPNTIGLDLVVERLLVQRDKESYELIPSGAEEWWAAGLRYLNAVNISNAPELRNGRASKWSFNLVPALHLSRKQVRATGLPASNGSTSDQNYLRWQVAGGLGPELGFQVSRHYFYLNLIPVYQWNEITWATADQKYQISEASVQTSSEIGYLYYLNSNWSLRLFSRTMPDTNKGWAEALNSRLPASSTSPRAYYTAAGISFCYRIEPRFKNQLWRTLPK